MKKSFILSLILLVGLQINLTFATEPEVSYVSNNALSQSLTINDFLPQIDSGFTKDFLKLSLRKYEFTTIPIFALSESDYKSKKNGDEFGCVGTGFIVLNERDPIKQDRSSPKTPYFPLQYGLQQERSQSLSWPHAYLISNAHVLKNKPFAYSFRFHCIASDNHAIRSDDDFIIATITLPFSSLMLLKPGTIWQTQNLENATMDIVAIDLDPIFTDLIKWGQRHKREYLPLFDGFDLDTDIHSRSQSGVDYGTHIEIYGYPDGSRDLLRNLPICISGSCATNPSLSPYALVPLEQSVKDSWGTTSTHEIEDFYTNTFTFAGSSGSPIVAEVNEVGVISKRLLGIISGSRNSSQALLTRSNGSVVEIPQRIGISIAIHAARLLDFIRNSTHTVVSQHATRTKESNDSPPVQMKSTPIRVSKTGLTGQVEFAILTKLGQLPDDEIAVLDLTELVLCNDEEINNFINTLKEKGFLRKIHVLKTPGGMSELSSIEPYSELLNLPTFEYLYISDSRIDKLEAHKEYSHKEKIISAPKSFDFDAIQDALANQNKYFSAEAHRKYYACYSN